MSAEAELARPNVVRGSRGARLTLRAIALGYLAALLLVPVGIVCVKAFDEGVGAAWSAVTSPEAQHAFWLTLVTVGVAVPLNTVFGVACAIVLVRHRFRGRRVLDALIDLPFAISPVVIGLALFIIYGRGGWFGETLGRLGIEVLFSVPGMVLATIFVSLPFVVREVMPVLREIGDEAEQAAATLGAGGLTTFRRITLPAIRWGVTYGVVLATARALGEFGAVSIVSGRISGVTETLPLYVQQQFETFNIAGAYAAALVLAVLAVATIGAMNLTRRREA